MSTSLASLRPKNPDKVKAGMAGMASRWRDHVPVTVRLSDLDPDMQRAITYLIETARKHATDREAGAR